MRDIYGMSSGIALSPSRRNSVPCTVGLLDKGHAFKWLVVCNNWDLEPLDLLNGMALCCYQLSPEVLIVLRCGASHSLLSYHNILSYDVYLTYSKKNDQLVIEIRGLTTLLVLNIFKTNWYNDCLISLTIRNVPLYSFRKTPTIKLVVHMIATAVGVGIWNILGSINPDGRGISICRKEMIIPKKDMNVYIISNCFWVGCALVPSIKKISLLRNYKNHSGSFLLNLQKTYPLCRI